MTEEIQPDHFDLIVLGTGLQESLIAGAAALSGLSVLHLDHQQFYGSHWAGLTLDQVLAWADNHIVKGEDARHVERDTNEGAVSSTTNLVHSDVQVLRANNIELGSLRQYNIDLGPKVLYTVDPVVEALLCCKAEDYLTFKLVQSCIWQDGIIMSVPASRAEVFKDRTLSPGEKRILMRFLKNVVDALNSDGPLKDAFDERPFCELLSQQGLPQHLQAVILYSLAMLDTAQAPLGPCTPAERLGKSSSARAASNAPPDTNTAEPSAREREPPSSKTMTSGRYGEVPDSTPAESFTSLEQPQSRRVESPEACSMQPQAVGSEVASTSGRTEQEGQISSKEGLKRLSQYLESVSRYGGAFMTPDYGTGELPQAFCRVAAVHGALYVLRCAVTELILDAESQKVAAVRTGSGQVLKCKAVAGHADALSLMLSTCNPASSGVSRVVCITDAPLQGAPSASNKGAQMLLTVPPGSLGGGTPTHTVRVLQLGPSTLATPPGRFLLHVSSPLNGTSSATDVASTIAALTRPLQSAPEPVKPPAGNDHSSDGKPHALLTLSYNQATGFELADNAPTNVALTQPPDVSVGYAAAMAGAEAAFKKLFPDRTFFPKQEQARAVDSDEE